MCRLTFPLLLKESRNVMVIIEPDPACYFIADGVGKKL